MNHDNKKLQFIIHRGSHQIGGNCLELRTPEARIIIDCGLPLDYDEQDADIQEKIHENAKCWLDQCDAVFLSHYHADHYGLLNDAPKGTKVYTSKETAELIRVSGVFGEDLTEHLDIKIMEGTVAVKDFRVTAYPVDHSAYGACAFHFEVADKSILYSGDIRLHGKKGVLYMNLPQNVDYLFLEGTNIGRGTKQRTETDMENEFIKQFEETRDSVHLVWCSSQNIDRIVALYRACKRTQRVLCIDPYAAYVLELAHKTHDTIPTAKTHPFLLNYYPPILTTKMMDKDKQLIYCTYQKNKKLDTKLLQAHPGKYVLLFRPSLLYYAKIYLNDVKVSLTNSIWAQYWIQDKPDINRLKEWLAEKPELRKKLLDIHTSGHADVPSLQTIVEHVKPKHIVPIHSEHVESFSSLFPDTTVMEVTDEMSYTI
ncbi:MAG: MBL fold metallo-hydrolase [Bacteroidales bacterium]|nr:MBL fold metallo-hydrolase [Bacteroidales bacterium]